MRFALGLCLTLFTVTMGFMPAIQPTSVSAPPAHAEDNKENSVLTADALDKARALELEKVLNRFVDEFHFSLYWLPRQLPYVMIWKDRSKPGWPDSFYIVFAKNEITSEYRLGMIQFSINRPSMSFILRDGKLNAQLHLDDCRQSIPLVQRVGLKDYDWVFVGSIEGLKNSLGKLIYEEEIKERHN